MKTKCEVQYCLLINVNGRSYVKVSINVAHETISWNSNMVLVLWRVDFNTVKLGSDSGRVKKLRVEWAIHSDGEKIDEC